MSIAFGSVHTSQGQKEMVICWNDVTSIERDYKFTYENNEKGHPVLKVIQDYAVLRFGTGEKIGVTTLFSEAVEKWKAAKAGQKNAN